MTTKYTFKAVFNSSTTDAQSTTIKEFNAECLPSILEEFREFLLGVGFSLESIKEHGLLDE